MQVQQPVWVSLSFSYSSIRFSYPSPSPSPLPWVGVELQTEAYWWHPLEIQDLHYSKFEFDHKTNEVKSSLHQKKFSVTVSLDCESLLGFWTNCKTLQFQWTIVFCKNVLLHLLFFANLLYIITTTILTLNFGEFTVKLLESWERHRWVDALSHKCVWDHISCKAQVSYSYSQYWPE